MSAVGDITFKIAYHGVRFFHFPGCPTQIKIERIAVQLGNRENYHDTYFVDFDKLENGSLRDRFVSANTKKASDTISAPLEAAKAISVRLEGRLMSLQIAATVKSGPTEFTSGAAHHIFIENFDGNATVTYPDSEEMLSDSDSDSSN